ncbi:hypothetical protein EVAR_72340_1 [Eumeta japonica]|uniref:Endonuclease/exonuclease/phosphatase domain-containing protein n=1 Tax=Eumeta variegata TaxID=151549 RepID=A0A4C1SY72_EUMVA|nr:hypothetical protein EVAR_72340_1 [Eumeta japonica]
MKILQLNINHCEAAHDLLMQTDAKQHHPVAIAGDFNAWAVDWGSKQTNARGRELLEAFSTLDIVLLNSGDRPTYTKGDASSIVDLTFVSTSLAKGSISWVVLDIYTASDHHAILWETSKDRNLRGPIKQTNTIGWKAIKRAKVDAGKSFTRGGQRRLGRFYKVVMTHLKKQQMPSPTCPQLLQKIVTALFPQQRSFDYQLEPGELDDIPPVTEEELLEACNRV